jgi:glyoxylase-like metal-dependent hydrolase (beta-lactamase superfamily II)
MKSRAFASVLTLACAAIVAPLSAQSLKVQKLAEGVWAAEPAKGANVGWFLLGDGVVAVDSGADAATAKDVLKQIAETTGGKPVRLLILTHSHADHSGGARAFVAAGARVLCQESVAGVILAFLTRPASEVGDPLASKPGTRPVVESISERSIMVDGLRNAQIYFLGAAHTSGDLIVYLPTEKILFGGDLALNGRQPFMQSPDVDPAGWERSLQSLSRVPVEKLVPGHGEIGPTGGLQVSLAYVGSVHALAKKLVERGAPDEVIDSEVRKPENEIPNVTVNASHIENVKSSVKAIRDKATKKTTPAPAPHSAPTPAK